MALTEDEELELLELEEAEYQATKSQKPEVSSLESGARGALQGASLGFADEIAGGAQSLYDIATTDKSLSDLGDVYSQRRDESRANYKKAEEANPSSYMAGEIGGGIASAFVPGLNIGKGAMATAKTGLALGAASGLGASDADNFIDLAIDTGKGSLIGGVAGGALSKGADALNKYGVPLIKKAGEKLGSSAERLSAKALGAERGTVKKLGADKIREIGRYGLDNKIVTPLASTDDMISRNESIQGKAGKQIGDVFSAIDEAGASTFNPREVATKVDEKLGDFYRSPINKGESSQLDNTIESILMRVGSDADAIPLSEAQILKRELGKVANWKNSLNVSDKERMARDAYGIVNSAIDDAAESGAKEIGKEGLEDLLSSGKSLFGNSKGAGELLSNKFAREEGNKMFGLTDWAAIGGGLAAAPATGGSSLAIPLVKKGFEKYGAQSGAVALDNISKKLLQNPRFQNLAQTNPTAFKAFVNNISSKMSEKNPLIDAAENQEVKPEGADKLADVIKREPQSFGKFAPALQKAIERGENALGVTDYMLQMTDPEYRELKKQMGGEE